MSSEDSPPNVRHATSPTPRETAGPQVGPVVVHNPVDVADTPRLEAELDGRIAVGTQVLVADVEEVKLFDYNVLAGAAQHLHDERSGSMVLRNPSAPFMRQLRLMRLNHMFELEN